MGDFEMRDRLKEEYATNKRLVINGIRNLKLAGENGHKSLSRLLTINETFENLVKRTQEAIGDKIQAVSLKTAISLKLKELLYRSDCLHFTSNDPSVNNFLHEFYFGDQMKPEPNSSNDPKSDIAYWKTEMGWAKDSTCKIEFDSLPESVKRMAIELVLDYFQEVIMKEVDIFDVQHLKHLLLFYRKLNISLDAQKYNDEVIFLQRLLQKGIFRLFKKNIAATKIVLERQFSSGLDLFFKVLDTYAHLQSEVGAVLDKEMFEKLFLKSTISDPSFLASDLQSRGFMINALKTRLALSADLHC